MSALSHQIPPPEDETAFEELCLDLYRSEFGDRAQLHGRKGQRQHGVDIVVLDKDIGIQCKKNGILQNKYSR